MLVNIAEHDSARLRYSFSDNKTKVQITGDKHCKENTIYLNETPLQVSDEETHLGIQRRSDTSNKSTISARIKTARRTVYSLMGAGMYGLNGINPTVSMKIIEIYIIPRLMYGLECLVITQKELQPMELYYRELLRQIQHLPKSTANPACYLLLGAVPIEALLHIRKLTLFGNILLNKDSVEFQIFERQLATKDNSSHIWVINVKHILEKYDMPSPIQLLFSLGSKNTWKRYVKTKVIQFWYRQLIATAKEMSSLQHLNLDHCEYGIPHPIWETGTDPLQIYRACLHIKILVQRYPLKSTRLVQCSSQTCPCCGLHPETLYHFLLDCQALSDTRTRQLEVIIFLLKEHNITASRENLIHAILDPTHITRRKDTIMNLYRHARSLCLNLHRTRVTYLNDTVKSQLVCAAKIKNRNNLLNHWKTPGAPPNGREIKRK